MERAQSPDVEQAARRLRRPRARGALVAKRTLDVLLAAAMLLALSPLIVLLLVLLGLAGRGWVEPRLRLGRDGRPIRIYRFRALPGGLGSALERLGARELPVLLAILFGRLSFVGPRALAARHRGRVHGPAAAHGARAHRPGPALRGRRLRRPAG